MNKKLILYGVGGVALVVGGYFLYKRLSQKRITFDYDYDETNNPNNEVSKPAKTGFPLQRGSKGKDVTSLQKFLKEEGQGYLLGTFGTNKDGVDGIFGKMTENAVKEQQTPFESFKISFPNAEFGKVSKEYFDMFIKGKY